MDSRDGRFPQQNVRFGAALRELRLERGLSLEALARVAHYSKSQLSKVENSRAQPTAQLARACDDALRSGTLLSDLVLVEPPSAPTSAPARVSGLPRDTPHFTGRTEELAHLISLLAPGRRRAGAARFCVLHGMPGVGKTTLAVRAANELLVDFPGGCVFIDLHGHTSDMPAATPDEAIDRCLRRLGIAAEAISWHRDDRAALLRDRVGQQGVLLVLDNVANHAQIASLLPGSGHCAVLITSRNRIAALDDVPHVQLAPLPTDAATELFRVVSDIRDPGPALGELIERTVGICGRLPLTVRITAARCRDQDVAAARTLLASLGGEDLLNDLDDGEREVTRLFAASVRALPVAQQEVFLSLAAHPGVDFDVFAASAMVVQRPGEVLRALEALTDANLILRGRDGRFEFHHLVRAYGARRASPELKREKIRRLAEYSLHVAQVADRLIAPHRYHPTPAEVVALPGWAPPATREDAVTWMSREFDTLVTLSVSTYRLGFDHLCTMLSHALQGFAFLTKMWDGWITAQTAGLAAARRTGDRIAEAYLLNGLGLAHIDKGDSGEASRCFHTSLAMFTELDDERGLCNTLSNLAWVHHEADDFARALVAHQRALRFHERLGAEVAAAITLRGIAIAEAGLGRFAGAIDHLCRALLTFDRFQLPLDLAMALNCLGDTYRHANALADAADAYRAARESGRLGGSRFEQARALAGLASVLPRQSEADRCLAEAQAFYGELGLPFSGVQLHLGP
ncbi:tetratricopeptide repeat protein [Amycolatopsis sp. NBC_01286]|uniref:tetratricopeptide repeat protein n=1 Tax=Amycolatopsis sp. NBC_01286 TaxID=2903560 RepID=UPI002E12E136|nr:tetratricopeptide repeat protein [Amycolatopsis sp. NBC_01286]